MEIQFGGDLYFCSSLFFYNHFNCLLLSHLSRKASFFAICIKFRQKSFRIWFQIGSYIFGRGQKMHFKKTIFGVCLHQQSWNISVIWPLIRKIRTLYFLQLLKLQEIKCPYFLPKGHIKRVIAIFLIFSKILLTGYIGKMQMSKFR